MVPRAFLRAFVPLTSFPAELQERWRDERAHLGVRASVRLEASVSTRMAVQGVGALPEQDTVVLVRRVGGKTHVCPLQLRERAALAVQDLAHQVPSRLLAGFFRTPDDLDVLEAIGDHVETVWMLESTWVVPLPWFVLFSPEDRRVLDPPEGRRARLIHLTRAGVAVVAADRALEIVEEHLPADALVDELVRVRDWADSLPPQSVLELDYGGVADGLDVAWLSQDHTCRDVWRALDALAEDDAFAAATHYGVIRSRWRELELLRRAS